MYLHFVPVDPVAIFARREEPAMKTLELGLCYFSVRICQHFRSPPKELKLSRTCVLRYGAGASTGLTAASS